MKFELTARRIKIALDNANMSAKELSEKTGVKEASISQYVNGYHKPSNINAGKIAEILNVSPLWLMGFDVPMIQGASSLPPYSNVRPIGKKRFPVLSEVACGEPILMQDEKELYVDASEDIKADFVLIAKGDSMIGAHIYDRDPVFIRAQQTVENGEIAAVGIGDEATLKRVYWYANRSVLVLKAENPDYPDMEFSGAELENIRIFGKAVMFQSRVR